MKAIKHNVSTMEVLLWESELTPKPEPHLITMPAQQGDRAYISDEKAIYTFNGVKWVK